MSGDPRDLILGSALVVDPRSNPSSGTALVVALARAGALGVLDIAAADDLVDATAAVTARTDAPFAIRPGGPLAAGGCPPDCDLPGAVTTVVLDAGVLAGLGTTEIEGNPLAAAIARWSDRRVLVEVTSRNAARRAVAAGADGLVAKGAESGGCVGDTEAFVLLQQTLDLGVPVWVRGGIGRHTAAAAVAAGARGVFLDSQLALVRESGLPAATRAAIAAMDGSETRVIAGHRVYTRPDLAVASRASNEPVDRVIADLGPDVRRDLVPVGQDASLAGPLADRGKTAGGVVTAIRDAIGHHLEAADEHRPLEPGAGLAASHGVRFPIAQGPMTRVSDRAAFAAAVADGGGLPFLALALLPGHEVEPLLRETAELLGDRPWGVGVLGFVPPELREEQLAVVQELRPPVALIAGGRPSQAAPLEAAGIATYLHVPSPGLLDRFVKDGARRFVFEGRECGGHVGPRASFPLWDAQVERLLAVDDPEHLHVLFAGGVHDARSAAAIAAVSAPLAERGAKVGVLMGTAYLFTKEAVATGAIAPAFQDTAVGCEGTVLLETSPGHATRCVETDYVRTFQETKAALEADGVDTKAMWAELETLNLGRLRVASKGLARGDDGLVEVDEATQRRDGMYMIGQVASLRDEIVTIADLHGEVSEGATQHLARLTSAGTVRVREPEPAPAPLDVAIVGMASFFPGSASADEFWSMILAGTNAITEVPPERWDAELYFDPASTTVGAGHKTPSKWGGFLQAIGFDPLAYGIPPTSLASVEPVQLLSLEVAARALADAGYADREFDRSRASVVFGAENGNDLSGAYGLRAMLPQLLGELPPELDQYLPTLTEDSFPGVLTNVIAGRIANRLDLGGVNFTVDAACAASLAALDAACKELVGGNSDLVLCGGADVHNGLNDFLLFSSVHALSPTGQCKTFDASADGIALGEGIACIVLKRRVDAERDGDRIYAVVDAVAGSSDGRHLGLTAPRKEGQQRALERAYAQARRSPAELGLVEAHGTGTVVGDKTELATLTEVFAEHDAPVGSCVLGSVKSQIGHTKCAAGLAGLIKTTRALYHGVLPPTGNLVDPNPAYDAPTSPFRFLTEPRPWVGAQRHAGVSAFGFGGANFHAVLSSYAGDDGPAHGVESWPAELFVIRAADADAARDRLEQLSSVVDAIVATDPNGERHRLRDLARTASETGSGAVQVALVATDLRDLADKLVVARSGTGRRDGVFLRADVADEVRLPDAERAGARPHLAFVHPGQGSQRPGMLADLFVTFPRLRPLLELAAPWTDALYPPAVFTADERAEQVAAVTDTRVAQPVLGLGGLAIAGLLGAAGVRPDAAAGHSYGELVALATAGAIDPAALLALSAARGDAIVASAAARGDDPGTMAAISASIEVVAAAVASHPDVVVANHNGPSQVVVSGTTAGIAAVVAELEASGIAAKRLNVACAFHSPLLADAPAALAARLAEVAVDAPQIPVYANTTAAPYPTDAAGIRSLLSAQVTGSVRFVDQIEAMYADGVRVFVEAGPGRVLTQLVGKVLGDRPHRAVACDTSGEHGVRRFLLALAELAVIGTDIDTDLLFDGRAATVSLADLPVRAPGWTLDGHLARTADGAVVAGSLQPADRFPVLAVGASSTPERDATVLEYLRSIREVVAAERDVMLHYLGAPADAIGATTIEPATAGSGGTASFPAPNGSGELAALEVAEAGGSPAAPTERVRGDALLAVILQIVADRTGYPTDMLDPDLDLEADLSIDSIKRIEIIGELAERIGLDAMGDGGVDDAMVEELAQLKSLREIVAWIDDLDVDAPTGATPDAPATIDVRDAAPTEPGTGAEPDADLGAAPVPDRAIRARFHTVGIDPPSAAGRLDGRSFLVADDGRGIAPLLADRLAAHGAVATVVAADAVPGVDDLAALGDADGLVWLGGLHPTAATSPGTYDARAAFAWWQPALVGRTTTLLAATAGAGTFAGRGGTDGIGLGIGAMAKTVARELTGVAVRAVDLDPLAPADALADLLASELLDLADPGSDGPVEVGYDDGRRVTRVVVADDLPLDDDARPSLALGPDSVVLLTGGARGITALAAIELARRHRCRIELVGRSPLPIDDEPDDIAAAADRAALRHVLLGTGTFTTPAAIEAECARLLAAREIRTTLAAIGEAGGIVAYHAVDVRDAEALAAVVTDVQTRHGRLDLVVHGAGVLDDRFLRDKSADGFDRVFATKVDAARTLLSRTGPDTVVAFFGSVSGVFGNRGQVDYSAANGALDELAVAGDRDVPGRAVVLDWGPWAGTGMVSPELEREYARRGIGLIEPDDGVAALLDALTLPRRAAQVVVLRAEPLALAPEMAAYAPVLEGAPR